MVVTTHLQEGLVHLAVAVHHLGVLAQLEVVVLVHQAEAAVALEVHLHLVLLEEEEIKLTF